MSQQENTKQSGRGPVFLIILLLHLGLGYALYTKVTEKEAPVQPEPIEVKP